MDDEQEPIKWPRHEQSATVRKQTDKVASYMFALAEPLQEKPLRIRPLRTTKRAIDDTNLAVKDCQHQFLITKSRENVAGVDALIRLANSLDNYAKTDSDSNVRVVGHAVVALRPFLEIHKIVPTAELQIYQVTIQIA